MPVAGPPLRRVRAARSRVLEQLSSDDDRPRHAWSASALLMLGAVTGIVLLPLLPSKVDRGLALAMAVACLLLGLVLPLLPWTRWPRSALLAPMAVVLPVIYGAGGFYDGALDYYALFLPLAFIYLGLAFPPVYSLWMLLLCLAATGAVFLQPQPPGVLPQVLLGSVLSAVCGTVLAVQRRTESHGHQAMRLLVGAATSLGGAQDESTIARLVAAVSRELLGADGAEVLLRCDDAETTTVTTATSGAPVHEPAGSAPGDPGERLAALLAGAASARSVAPYAAERADATAHQSARLVVPVPGGTRPHGAIVVLARDSLVQHRSTVRALLLLAAETGRVLDRLQHTRQLLRRSRTDPLTGLANRGVLQEAMDASSCGDAFVLVDLDHFKQVNDTCGHAAGDEMLRCFAAALRDVTRPGQLVARFGGEEFALLLPGLDEAALQRYLTDLRSVWAAQRQGVTFSSGVAVRQPSESAAEALARADEALYEAKGGGRDQDRHHRGLVSQRH